MDNRVMTTDELLGFSKTTVEPIEVEIKEGFSIKIEPMGLIDTLKIQEQADMETPEGIATYMATVVSSCIVEPELSDEQKEQLKSEVMNWPAPLVNKIMSEYYEKIGVGEEELEKAIGNVEGFLAEEE